MVHTLKSFIFGMFLLLGSALSQAALPLVDSQGQSLPSLAPMLKRVNPAVVNIATFSTRQTRINPLLNDPFFKFFFDLPDQELFQPQPERREQSAGSGVIVDRFKGIVLTNHHVIKGADEVQVALTDGRKLKAEILGIDPALDIAVLKIPAVNLSQVDLSDSERLQVGDFVVAIGNPFSLGQTVTTGIVSALGRTGLGIEGFENFIQTDASINPGNSGGALVDLAGNLIGINTAIMAPSGGNIGIGFAIPANMAKASMEQILKYGKVRRGDPGFTVQEVSSELREAFNLPPGQQGVLVSQIKQGSSAEYADINSGDIVVQVDGVSVPSVGVFKSQMAIKAIDQRVNLRILRQNQFINRFITMQPYRLSALKGRLSVLLGGIGFEDATEREGVLIAEMTTGAYAREAGLQTGDIVYGVNNQRIRDINEFDQALKKSDALVVLHFYRDRQSYKMVLR